MKSQNATATLGTVMTCPPEVVSVPLDVTDFVDIGAMTLDIGFDTNNLEFNTLYNINPVIPGNILYNSVAGVVSISWSSIVPFTINNGTLFELEFNYTQDSSSLTFDFIEIANSQLDIIEVETTSGAVVHQINILQQPDSLQVYPGSNANFLVLSSGNDFYQWQEDDGTGWDDLSDTGPYSGTSTNLLTINSVTLSLDGNIYRCILYTSDDCMLASAPALLNVAEAFPEAVLGETEECPNSTVEIPLNVSDFNDVVSFTFNVIYDEDVLEFSAFGNVNPLLQNGNLITSPLINPNGLSIQWSNPTPINFGASNLFNMIFDYNSDTTSLSFADGTEVINSFGNPMVLTTVNGGVMQHELPEMIVQPVNDTVESGEDASFYVEASNTSFYQWQLSENNGLNWTDLQNVPPYSNVATQQLLITSATTNLSGNLYRCIITGEYCSIRSNFARLVVDSTVSVVELPITDELIVYPNPTDGWVYFNVGKKRGSVCLFDVAGNKMERMGIDFTGAGKLDLSPLPVGTYFLKFEVNTIIGTYIVHRKIVKFE